MSGLMKAGYLEKHPDDRKKARHFRFRPARQGVGLDYVIAKQPTKSMTEPAPKDPDQHKPEPAQPVRRVVTTTAPKIPTPKEAEQDPAIAALFACRVELVTKLDRIDRAIAILRGEQ